MAEDITDTNPYVYYEVEGAERITLPLNRAANFALTATLDVFPDKVSVRSLQHPTTEEASMARQVKANILSRLRWVRSEHSLQPDELAELLSTTDEGAVRACEEGQAILTGGSEEAILFKAALSNFEALLVRGQRIRQRE